MSSAITLDPPFASRMWKKTFHPTLQAVPQAVTCVTSSLPVVPQDVPKVFRSVTTTLSTCWWHASHGITSDPPTFGHFSTRLLLISAFGSCTVRCASVAASSLSRTLCLVPHPSSTSSSSRNASPSSTRPHPPSTSSSHTPSPTSPSGRCVTLSSVVRNLSSPIWWSGSVCSGTRSHTSSTCTVSRRPPCT
eukprot:PhF_6_TR42991/c1_g1_i1/m.65574